MNIGIACWILVLYATNMNISKAWRYHLKSHSQHTVIVLWGNSFPKFRIYLLLCQLRVSAPTLLWVQAAPEVLWVQAAPVFCPEHRKQCNHCRFGCQCWLLQTLARSASSARSHTGSLRDHPCAWQEWAAQWAPTWSCLGQKRSLP